MSSWIDFSIFQWSRQFPSADRFWRGQDEPPSVPLQRAVHPFEFRPKGQINIQQILPRSFVICYLLHTTFRFTLIPLICRPGCHCSEAVRKENWVRSSQHTTQCRSQSGYTGGFRVTTCRILTIFPLPSTLTHHLHEAGLLEAPRLIRSSQ
jgi:hypothetical protein